MFFDKVYFDYIFYLLKNKNKDPFREINDSSGSNRLDSYNKDIQFISGHVESLN